MRPTGAQGNWGVDPTGVIEQALIAVVELQPA
jgi:hypothetical protein